MKNSMFKQSIIALCLAAALPALAQAPRISPHETISAVLNGNRVTITYGRPYSKAPRGSEIRKIWGSLVPYGKAWRLGSDEATVIIFQKPVMLGDLEVPAGAYTAYLVPMESGASKLALSKTLGGWGIPVDEGHDFARVDVQKEALDKQTDQLTLALETNPNGGRLKIMWESTQFVLPITVKK